MKEWIIKVPEDGRIINSEPVCELVRCKDCKFYPNGDGATKWTPCREIIVPPCWFCADGEKRDG